MTPAPQHAEPAAKFTHPDITAKGEPRAQVAFRGFRTLWLNTGTLCNITCVNCYIESSPTNDRLVYLTPEDVTQALDDLAAMTPDLIEIGFTGGEPFLNPDIIALLDMALVRGHSVLVLTNAMRPMMRPRVQAGLLGLRARFGDRLTMRVSLDHWSAALHDGERGGGGFEETCAGIDWLTANRFRIALAGRTCWGADDGAEREGFARLIAERGWAIDPEDKTAMVLFPEMDARADVPEITPACWGILGVDPAGLMCASARMLVKRRGAGAAEYVACTLLPYEPQFSFGPSLEAATAPVKLNHPHCAKFCVLGGGSCSG